MLFLCGFVTFGYQSFGASCFSLPSGAIAWWPGDIGPNDIVSTNNGTFFGGAAITNTGNIGSAFQFDGTNSYVRIAESSVFHPSNLTIEAWVRFSNLNSQRLGTAPAGDQYMVFKQNSRQFQFEGFDLSKTRAGGKDVFRFQLGSSTGAEIDLHGVTAITTNIWYHVAAVRDSNSMQLYVNGVLEGTTNVPFAQDYGTQPVYFGTSGQPYWDAKLSGTLDEVTIYNRALSSSEVASVYAATNFGKCKAISITQQPTNQTVIPGSTVSMVVAATGLPALGYQWRFNSTNLPGATTSALSLANAQAGNAGPYLVVVSNSLGAVTSSVAVLTVLTAPTISSQPQSITNVTGSDASFAVGASGNPVPGYTWTFNGSAIAGATASTLTATNVRLSSGGNYAVVVTNVAGSLTSAVALLTVWEPPGISTQPQSQTNVAGTPATFSVLATGTPAPGYVWQFNGSPISTATAASLTLSNIQPVNGGNYSVVLTNSAGSLTSAVGVLTVWVPPAFTLLPSSLTNVSGTDASFSATASGTPSPGYQWQFNGTALPGATGSSLTVSNVQPGNRGNYSVVASNTAGSLTSSVAVLTVWVAPSISQ
ncbi:MAG TPA: immunoglobulin domain-containing protein, partial [Candidatus Dormibacteraeota bacterium]|nr:immunoglobulin domain-containing protein [Candidatus Dormibacteraeota bacterium]